MDLILCRSLSLPPSLPSVQVDVEDLDEEDTDPLSPLDRQCREIWNTVQLTAVWRPMVSRETERERERETQRDTERHRGTETEEQRQKQRER
jgi:hypothetical protein